MRVHLGQTKNCAEPGNIFHVFLDGGWRCAEAEECNHPGLRVRCGALTRAEGNVGTCSPVDLTQGELRCCSKIGTTRNTSTSCNQIKNKIKKEMKLKVGVKISVMVNIQNSFYMFS